MVLVLGLVAAVALIIALVGVVIPGLPGIQVLWVLVALDYWLFNQLQLPTFWFWVLTLLALMTLGIDYLATLLGVKKRGGSLLGIIGSFVGLIGGALVANIPGMLFGCFTGTLLGELIHGQQLNKATSVAIGSLIGYAVATALKLVVWACYTIVIYAYVFRA